MPDPLATPNSAAVSGSSAATPPRPPRRWGRWLLAGVVLLVLAGAVALQLLDPWLRRTLEQQVARQTHGQYRLQVGALHTRLWQRAIWLERLRLRPAAAVADTLPRLRLDAARLHVTGVGLLALLRRGVVPLDSVVLDSARVEVLALPSQPTRKAGQPLHQRLPLGIEGLRIGYFGLLHTQAAYLPKTETTAYVEQTDLSAHDLLISPAGAADTQRVAYAAAWSLQLRQARATVAAHALALGSLRLSTAAGTFGLRAVRIRPPTPGRGKPGGMRIDLTLPRLAFTGLDAAALQHGRQFRAATVVLDRPRLAFTPPAQPPPPVWKLLSTFVRRTDIGQLLVQHAEAQLGGVRHAPEVHDLNLTGRALRIDSLTALAPGRIAYARSWQATSGLVAAPFDPPYYRATSQHARLDTDARTARFDDILLKSKYTSVGMNLHKGYQAPSLRLALQSLAAQGLDFAALVRRNDVRVARLTARDLTVRISSDGRGPLNPNLSKATPEQVRLIPVRLDVRRLDIVNGNLYSTYRSPLTPIPGTMSINRFGGTFRNLSNDPRRQTPATPFVGQAHAYLQNRCRLDVQASAYLLDPRGRHRVWGTFGPGPFAMLNSMTAPTRLAEFKSGDVRRLRFDLQGDRQRVTGTMRAEYADLQLALLSYKDGAIKQPLLKRVISKAANVVVIRDQNPRKGGRLVTGDMTSTREPRFSVFTLWRQGLVSGLFNNVGVPQKLAQKLSETADTAPLPSPGRRAPQTKPRTFQ